MAEYNSAHTGPEIDAAVSAVKTKQSTWDNKQDKITGKAGQVVGFDASGNPIAQEAPSGGASSWNDLKDKPVILEGGDTLTWDGNTEGRTTSDLEGMLWVHVSDAVPSMDDLANGVVLGGPNGEVTEIPAEHIIDLSPDGFHVIMVTESGICLIALEDNVENFDVLLPEKGIYLLYNGEDNYTASLTIPGYTGFATEKLDPAYLYQPNWNQSDESAPDYVKNRTHHDAWSANKFAQEIAFTTNDGATFGNFNQSLGLEAGKTYTILCDGDEYTGVAEAVDLFGTTAVRVGDFDAIGGTSETMSTPICVYDMGDGTGVVFLKETFTEETSKFVVVLEGKNKEEYWIVALDPAESPLYSNMFVASWKPVPYSDFAHGFSAVLSIDGVEYSVNDADPKVFVTSTPDGYWTLHYDSIMVALCSESAIVFINDTQAGLNNTPQVDMKKLTFNVPVFAPSMELKKLDSKYLPTPSWNDLADKPFGDVDVVFLDEEALAFEGGYTSVDMKSFAPIGSMVTVVLDGTTYTWQVVAAGQDSGFGNLALLGEGEDTGESLCGVFAADLGGLILMSADAEASSHAVKITGKDVVKLPTNYYNSTVCFYASTDGYLYLDVTRTTKATRSDVEQVVGKIPITVVYGLTFMQAIAVDCSSTNEFVTVTCYRNGNFGDYHTAEYTSS